MKLFSKLAIILCFGIVLTACAQTDSEEKNFKQGESRLKQIVEISQSMKAEQEKNYKNAQEFHNTSGIRCDARVDNKECEQFFWLVAHDKEVVNALTSLRKSGVEIWVVTTWYQTIGFHSNGAIYIPYNEPTYRIREFLGLKNNK